MNQTLAIIQVIISTLLIGSILLQQRGTSLGSSFGGDSGSYSTRRGLEKKLFIATIVLAVLFFGSAIARFLI